jgi:hypothetical protein
MDFGRKKYKSIAHFTVMAPLIGTSLFTWGPILVAQ